MKVTEEKMDELCRAFSEADYSGTGNADWEDEHLRIGIAAVLALIELESEPESDDPMPVFVIKAKDALASQAVLAYRALCQEFGLREQAHEVGLAFQEMLNWRERNRELIKNPDHKHIPARSEAGK